jgi:hypothetical protein
MSSSLSRTSQAGINVVRSMGLPEAVSGLSEAVAHVRSQCPEGTENY